MRSINAENCEGCELYEYNLDLEEENENLAEKNRELVQIIKEERAMTREEAISRLNKFAENAYGPWHDGDADIEAIDMAIEALDERKVELFDDGTLVVNVKEGEKVGRVLIAGDDHFGGLYYADYGEREEE